MGKSSKKKSAASAAPTEAGGGSLADFLLGGGTSTTESRGTSLFDTSTASKFERGERPAPIPKAKRQREEEEAATKKKKVRPARPLKSEKEASKANPLIVATRPLQPEDLLTVEDNRAGRKEKSKETSKQTDSAEEGSGAKVAGAAKEGAKLLQRKEEKKVQKDKSKEEQVVTAVVAKKKEKKKKKKVELKAEEEEEQVEGQEQDWEDEDSLEPKDELPAGDDEAEERAALTVFVGNLPVATTKGQLIALFKQAGEIESVRLRSIAVQGTKIDQHGNQSLVKKVSANKKLFATDVKDTCNAYIVFKSEESAEKAAALNNKEFNGKHLRVDHLGRDMSKDYQRSAFLGNLPFDVADEEVRAHFAALLEEGQAAIEGVRIVRDPDTQQGKGFGFLLLKDKVALAEVLRAGEQTLKGRTIRVTTCGRRMKVKDGSGGSKKKRAAAPRGSFEGRRASDTVSAYERRKGKAGSGKGNKKGGGGSSPAGGGGGVALPGLRLKKRGGPGLADKKRKKPHGGGGGGGGGGGAGAAKGGKGKKLPKTFNKKGGVKKGRR